MSSKFREIVVLLLKRVTFRHSEFRLLEDVFIKKYGFSQIEEKEYKISELKKPVEKIISSFKIYEGTYLDSIIRVYILGNIIQEEDRIDGIGVNNHYLIHTTHYEMIKFLCERGYVIQQLLERLTGELGLDIRTREWVFQRIEEP